MPYYDHTDPAVSDNVNNCHCEITGWGSDMRGTNLSLSLDVLDDQHYSVPRRVSLAWTLTSPKASYKCFSNNIQRNDWLSHWKFLDFVQLNNYCTCKFAGLCALAVCCCWKYDLPLLHLAMKRYLSPVWPCILNLDLTYSTIPSPSHNLLSHFFK